MMITVNSSNKGENFYNRGGVDGLRNSRSNTNMRKFYQFGKTQSIMKNKSKETGGGDDGATIMDSNFKYGGLRSISSTKEYNLQAKLARSRGHLTQMLKYKDDNSSSQ